MLNAHEYKVSIEIFEAYDWHQKEIFKSIDVEA